jgi:NAD(P)-dependent dehydrogenase (short-subunit alcohol dehydrogenase family)
MSQTENAGEYRPKQVHAESLAYPGSQERMQQQPDSDLSNYLPAGKLSGKKALLTGADSGIGRAVALGFALEGADVAILYNESDEDAEAIKKLIKVRTPNRKCILIKSDVRDPAQCLTSVRRAHNELGGLNILVNNAAYQKEYEKFESVPEENIRRTFATNILGYLWMAQAAIPFLKEGDAIVNTGSITGLAGSPGLIDYSATKGAIHAFTKSLALQLGERGIRVNCIAPGPIWTPLIPATLSKGHIENFGKETALGRPGQPEELVGAYVLMAGPDGSYITGAILEVTGGKLSSES